MHTQVSQEAGPKLAPIASLLGGRMAESPNPGSLGARIAHLRRAEGLTQVELAERLQDALIHPIEAFISKTT